jgi:hypothetical protein
MIRRSPRRALLLSLASTVLFAACSNSPQPTAETSELPEGSRVSTTVSEEPGTTVTIPVGEPETATDVLDRVSDTGEIRAADLRFLLLDAEGYVSAFEPVAGPGVLRVEGELPSSALPSSRTAGLGEILGFSRTFDANSGLFAVRSDAYLLSSPDTAKTFASRYIAELTKAGVAVASSSALNSKFPEGSLGDPSFVGAYRTEGGADPRSCHSVAIATAGRFVISVTVDHSDCLISTAEWSAALAKVSLERTKVAQTR